MVRDEIMNDQKEKKSSKKNRGVGSMFGFSFTVIGWTIIHKFSGLPGWIYFVALLPLAFIGTHFGNWLQHRKDD